MTTINFQDVMADEEDITLEEANKKAFDDTWEYFSFNGWVFRTMPPATFDEDFASLGIEEYELDGYPNDEIDAESLSLGVPIPNIGEHLFLIGGDE